jgi:hypothetical protein
VLLLSRELAAPSPSTYVRRSYRLVPWEQRA